MNESEQILNKILNDYMHKINLAVAQFELHKDDNDLLIKVVDSLLGTYSVGYHMRSLILKTNDKERIYDWMVTCYIYKKRMEMMKKSLRDADHESIEKAAKAYEDAQHALEILLDAEEKDEK